MQRNVLSPAFTDLLFYTQDACVQFWPEKTGEETLYGKISVTFKSEEESEGFMTRKFEISEEGRVRVFAHDYMYLMSAKHKSKDVSFYEKICKLVQ